jgi:hypothetical protein
MDFKLILLMMNCLVQFFVPLVHFRYLSSLIDIHMPPQMRNNHMGFEGNQSKMVWCSSDHTQVQHGSLQPWSNVLSQIRAKISNNDLHARFLS